MKIAIVGAGVAGRALWRFIELHDNQDVEIFDIKHVNRCGIHPCAWGVEKNKFADAHDQLHLPMDTIYQNFMELNLAGDMVDCSLCTFDKPAFLEQMCSSDNIKIGFVQSQIADYDLVVDATGEKRALLPAIPDDTKITCRQALYRTTAPYPDISMFPSKAVGYAWAFPLGKSLVHIGQGAMNWENSDHQTTPTETLAAMRCAEITTTEPICKVSESQIRMLTPKYCQPITWMNIVGVGESIGAISPHSGGGIIPAIKCAKILADNILDAPLSHQRYTADVLKAFKFMDRETKIVKKLVDGKRLSLFDLICLYKNDRWFGLHPGGMQLIRALRQVGAKLV